MRLFFKKRTPKIKVKSKKKDKLIFMVMRDLGTPVKELRVSTRLLTFCFSFFCIALITFGAASYYLVQEYMDSKVVVAALYKENDDLIYKTASQESMIDDLRWITDNMLGKMLDKMENIESLNSEVRSMVGLEETHHGDNNVVAGYTVSRGEGVANRVLNAIDEEYDILADLIQELYDMDLKMTEQALELYLLKDDVDRQLAFEAALPSLWPMEGIYISPFGNRRNPVSKVIEFHQGIDIANITGTKIHAAGDGVVTFSGYKSGWGRMVLVSHGYGYVSQYAHCNSIYVLEGQTVAKGEVIATCGSTGKTTGSHLHYGIQYQGKFIDPMKILIPAD